MFTLNYYKLLAGLMNTGKHTFITMTDATRSFSITAYDSVVTSAGHALGFKKIDTVVSSTTASGVFLGTGDTAPNLSDNKLSGSIIKDLTTMCSVSVEDIENGFKKTCLITMTNNTDSDITVKEIGYGYNVESTTTILIDRTVLSQPVTIPANGGVAQITYEVTLGYPS